MYGEDFEELLTGTLSSVLVWESAHLCPCVGTDGAADRACPVCLGLGRYYSPPSAQFRAGLVGLSARAMAAIQARFGPQTAGDATVSLPVSAPCWAGIREGDRLSALDAKDAVEWSLAAGDAIRLPYLAVVRGATQRVAGVIVPVAPPIQDASRKITVTVPTVVAFTAPRRYEVVRDLSQVRAFTSEGSAGLPKKILLKLIDGTVR